MTENKNLEYASEDTVQCFFFSASSNSEVMFWEHLCTQINKTIEAISVDYIWHRDEFKVFLPIDSKTNDDVPAHLISTTCFGDNLEDEWFIVYLILEITKKFEDIIVQIKDNDGDFILIEAADYLPSWANPDCTENRVFIYKNHMHIIPPTVADLNTNLSLKDGINYVVQLTEQTKAPEIQQAIQKRIGQYPDTIKENIHRANVKLPLDVAALLAIKPSLISPLVSSYCNHDEIDAKSCRNVSFDNRVTVGVKFTKFLYAMLVHSKLIKSSKFMSVHKDNKKEILGLKLTCGYEMIKNKSSEDIFSTKEFNKFIKILNESGYFRENLEGSQSYNQLLEKAKEFYIGIECPINSSVANCISQVMGTNEFIEMKETLRIQCASESDFEEDSEEWLNINPEQLNDLLNKRYGKQSNLKNNDIISPQSVTSELTNFLKKTSDFEGIEREDESDSDDDNIEFDSDEFVNTLKNMMNFISSGNNEMEMDSDFSDDYGDDVLQEDDELDEELKAKLNIDEKESSKTVLQNILKSMKEEKGSTGPSSNILRSIGINKTDLLDSDDD